MNSHRKQSGGFSSFSFKVLFGILSVLVLTTLTSSLHAQSQRNNLGKEFYICYPANEGSDENHTFMAVYLTSRTPASGTITVAGLPWDTTFTTTPGQITTVVLPSDQFGNSVEITQSEQQLPGMAVHIVSNVDVAVYGVNHKFYSSDAFMGLPVNVLGTEYRAMSYQSSGVDPHNPGEFVIVATAGPDSTHVTITPKAATALAKPANVPFTVTLGQGDVYMVQGDQDDPQNDLTGSLIESDYPIAVFSGHKRTAIPQYAQNDEGGTSRNNLVEQMPPVSAWGDSALVVPYDTKPYQPQMPDLVRIISSEDNNQIKINGALATTLNAGDFYEIPKLSSVTSINATNPILVGQYMHTSWLGSQGPTITSYGDPCLAIDFPVEQFDTEYTIISVVNPVAFTGNYVNLVVPQSGLATITLDGAVVPASSFTAIPGSNYEYAQVSIKQGPHNLHCAQPFGATVYALGAADAYAYTGGSKIATITPLKTVDLVIDFKDRLVQPGTFAGKFDTTVPITNISSDPVSIAGYQTRTGDVTKFYVTSPTPTQTSPEVITSGSTDSVTIEFQPLEINRREHTELVALTAHLRAYVVDLYGRGVLDALQFYSDSVATHVVDTVDFGTWVSTDPPVDTIVYLSNHNGSAPASITTLALGGPEVNYFKQVAGAKPPFSIDTGIATSAVKLEFTPGIPGPNGVKVATLTVNSASGLAKTIVLIGRIETPLAETLNVPTFDSILTCKNEVHSVVVQNPNDRSITIDSVVIAGLDPNDFTLNTKAPINVSANGTANVDLNFQPASSGPRSALIKIYFNFPVGTVDSFTVSGFGTISNIVFAADTGIHILGGENFTMDVRSLTDLGPFGATGYTLQLDYDSTYINFQNEIQDNTHSYFGYFVPSGIPGHELLTYQSVQDSAIWGGGPLDSLPLIILQFSSSSSASATTTTPDPTFSARVKIGVNVQLQNAILQGPCISSSSTDGSVLLDSACGSPGVIVASGAPLQSAMDLPTPNPFSTTTVIHYGVAHPAAVRLIVTDILGRPVDELVNAWQKPGFYSATFDATGRSIKSGMFYVTLYAGDEVSTRKLILAR